MEEQLKQINNKLDTLIKLITEVPKRPSDKIINIINKDSISEYLQSSSGEKVLLNVINRNKKSFQTILK